MQILNSYEYESIIKFYIHGNTEIFRRFFFFYVNQWSSVTGNIKIIFYQVLLAGANSNNSQIMTGRMI